MVAPPTDLDAARDLDEDLDSVVLLDDGATPIGVAPRGAVHTTDTPLHLAFSLYVFDGGGRLLLTRRALGKAAWPGVWTNTCCGHPRPGEAMEDAVHRRLGDELGLPVTDLTPALPDFRYRAVDANGVVEHEVCPVFTARPLHPERAPLPNPDEVMDWKWVRWDDVTESARLTPFLFSPWSVLQMAQLRAPGVPGPRP